MKSEIQIDNNAGVCQIDIEGTIGVPEEWQFDRPEARVATYEKFRDAVRRIAEIDASEVVVNIRSTGGDVNDALLIPDALTALGAHITTRCYGYTASAATIIAQAASPGCREISANALYLIHTAVCATEGNAAELNGVCFHSPVNNLIPLSLVIVIYILSIINNTKHLVCIIISKRKSCSLTFIFVIWLYSILKATCFSYYRNCSISKAH